MISNHRYIIYVWFDVANIVYLHAIDFAFIASSQVAIVLLSWKFSAFFVSRLLRSWVAIQCCCFLGHGDYPAAIKHGKINRIPELFR